MKQTWQYPDLKSKEIIQNSKGQEQENIDVLNIEELEKLYLDTKKEAYLKGFLEGKKQGFLEGETNGYQIGEEKGQTVGQEYGFEIGYQEGILLGEKEINQQIFLINKLKKQILNPFMEIKDDVINSLFELVVKFSKNVITNSIELDHKILVDEIKKAIVTLKKNAKGSIFLELNTKNFDHLTHHLKEFEDLNIKIIKELDDTNIVLKIDKSAVNLDFLADLKTNFLKLNNANE